MATSTGRTEINAHKRNTINLTSVALSSRMRFLRGSIISVDRFSSVKSIELKSKSAALTAPDGKLIAVLVELLLVAVVRSYGGCSTTCS